MKRTLIEKIVTQALGIVAGIWLMLPIVYLVGLIK
jgi:hypothetical protein